LKHVTDNRKKNSFEKQIVLLFAYGFSIYENEFCSKIELKESEEFKLILNKKKEREI